MKPNSFVANHRPDTFKHFYNLLEAFDPIIGVFTCLYH